MANVKNKKKENSVKLITILPLISICLLSAKKSYCEVYWIGKRPKNCTTKGKNITLTAFQKKYPLKKLNNEENLYYSYDSYYDQDVAIKKDSGEFCNNLPIEYTLKDVLGNHLNFHEVYDIYLQSKNEQTYYLVMEYLNESKKNKLNGIIENDLGIKLIIELINALLYLTKNKINPFDLAYYNILIDKNENLRIFDWEQFVINDEYDPMAFSNIPRIFEMILRSSRQLDQQLGKVITRLFNNDTFKRFKSHNELNQFLREALQTIEEINEES